MKVEKDFEELLRLFNKYKVRYCIIGAFAFGFYAQPRYTKDIDILVEPEIKNGEKIINAMNEFGFKSTRLSAKDFIDKNKIIQLGYEPVRVDILMSIKNLNFEDIWKNKKIGNYGKEKVFLIGLNDLIKSKKISNRKQDKVDLEILSSVRRRSKIR